MHRPIITSRRRFLTTTAAAAALGCMLSFILPIADQTLLGEPAGIESAASLPQPAVVADEGDDMISQLW